MYLLQTFDFIFISKSWSKIKKFILCIVVPKKFQKLVLADFKTTRLLKMTAMVSRVGFVHYLITNS